MKRTLELLALSLCMVGATARAADDPQLGHWMLDLARSHYVSGTPPKSSEVTITPFGKDGVSVTVNAVTATGEKSQIQYSASYDGKPNPRIETGAGAIAGQTVTLRRVDARTAERVLFLDGRAVGTEHWVISSDGKTRTVTQSGTDSKGKTIDNLQLYARQ